MIHGNGPTCNPETNILFEELRQDTLNNFTMPNSTLYPECVDQRTVRCQAEHNRVTSLAVALRKYHRSPLAGPVVTKHEKEKAERARRVEIMRQKLEDAEVMARMFDDKEAEIDLTIEPDDDKLYRKQLEFCAAATRAGWMTFDDE